MNIPFIPCMNKKVKKYLDIDEDDFQVSSICVKNWSSKIKEVERAIKHDRKLCNNTSTTTSSIYARRTPHDQARFHDKDHSLARAWYERNQASPAVSCGTVSAAPDTVLTDIRDVMVGIKRACDMCDKRPNFMVNERIDSLYKKYRAMKADIIDIKVNNHTKV